MSEAREFLVSCLLSVLQPKRRQDLPDWMAENVVLRREESVDGAGFYDPKRSIPMGRLFAKFNAGKWRKLIVKKGSQSAFTLHCLGDITKTIAEDPQNLIFAIDSEREARRISKKRLGPMLADCKATADLWVEHQGEQTALEYQFPSMTLSLIGSGSAGAYANKTAGRSYADEVDKHPSLEGEAPTLDLLEQRGKAVEGSVMIAGSTPTTERGQITLAHKTGSQELYQVPCPVCGAFQVLEWNQVRFNHCRRSDGSWDLHRVLRETFYECISKGCRIEESDKLGMIERGWWEPSNFIEIEGEMLPAWEPEVMSAHLPDLYSISPNSTWGILAKEFVQARNDPRKMHNFLNSRMGLETKETVVKIESEGVRRLASGYLRGSMPEVPCTLIIQADNQGDQVVKWVVSGMMPDGSQYVVDWGQVDAREKLDEVARRSFDCNGRRLVPQRGIIDEGGEEGTTWEVREFAARRWPFWLPAKGRSGRQINDLAKISAASIAKGGEEKIPVVHFDDDAFKRLLYLQRIARFDPARVEKEGLSRLFLPRDVSDQFCRELSGENLRRVPGKGVMWVASPPNDFGDCVKLGEVLWNVIGGEFR